MKTLFSILFFGLLLFSCGKKRTIVITATNAATGQRIAGLPYYVFSSYTGGNGQKYKTVASGVLNSQGEATIQLRQIPNKSYCVKVDEPSNTCYNKVITMYFGSPNDEDGHFNFKFAECAYMQQNISNVNCEGASDEFLIQDKFTYTEWTGWTSVMGCFNNVGGGYSKVPAGKRYFKWKVIRPSGITEHLDSLELAPGQYGDLNIYY